MSHNKIIPIFNKAFGLVNKNLDLLLIYLIIEIPTYIQRYIPDGFLSSFLSKIDFIFIFIGIAYSLSIPILLVKKIENKSFGLKQIAGIIFKNTKRIIIPILAMGIILFVAIIAILLIKQPSAAETREAIENAVRRNIFNPVFIFATIIASLFAYTSIYFSVENKGLISSMKESVGFTFRNLIFTAYIAVGLIVSLSISMLLPVNQIIFDLVRSIMIGYISYFLTAASLIYYQSLKKNK